VRSSSDFNPRKPKVFVGGNIGFNMPKAGSDIYDMVTSELTLEKSDFRATAVGFDFGVPIASHFAIVTGFEYYSTKTKSESRNYVENNGDPIEQTTELSQYPFTVTLRYYPRKTGESVGSYAWIPTRVNPYVAGGVGAHGYKFEQHGRFVDKATLNIFSTALLSEGWTSTVHFAGGIDINLTPRIFVNGEARYSRAYAELSRAFTGFEPIDLSGFRIRGGIYFRF
jgi:opacity protein-like surface antigen